MSTPRQLESEKSREVIASVPVLHPFLLALYPLLGLYAYNQDKAQVLALGRPAIGLLIAATVLLLFFGLLYRSTYRGGMAASWLLFVTTSGWNVLAWIMQVSLPELAGRSPWVYGSTFVLLVAAGALVLLAAVRKRGRVAMRLLALWLSGAVLLWLAADFGMAGVFGRGPAWFIGAYGLIMLAGLLLIAWIRRNLAQTTWTLNVFGAALLVISFANNLFNRPGPVEDAVPPPLDEAVMEAPATEPPADEPPPDIYFIVLGGYASPEILSSVGGYNLRPFLDEMESNGFLCADNSFSNYPTDMLSLASCLNMDYLQSLGPAQAEGLEPRTVIEWYHNNRLYDFLSDHGYTIEVFSPGNETLEPREQVASVWRQAIVLPEFERVLVESSALRPMIQLVHHARHGAGAESAHIFDRLRTKYVFNHLEAVAKSDAPNPRFIQAFLHVPEMPFIFDRDGGWPENVGLFTYAGRTRIRPELGPRGYWRLYTDQVHATNRLVRRVVEAICSNEDREAVVVVCSAYGPGLYMAYDEPSPGMLMQRYANLLMVRFPEGMGPSALPPNMTLVNLFRLVLNESFDTRLPMLPNLLYMPMSPDPITFEPVIMSPREAG